MVRLSKQARRRNVSFKRPRKPSTKTGPKVDACPAGFKEHHNAIAGPVAAAAYFPKNM